MKKLVLAAPALAVLALAVACNNPPVAPSPATPTSVCTINVGQGVSINICGNGNTVTTPGATPSPTVAAGACVPQTAPFSCTKGTPTFQAILEAVQRTVPDAPEAIYVPALVSALNQVRDSAGNYLVCATHGTPLASDEVAIKARVSNSQSETWDVKNANGSVQAIPASPTNICTPSRF